MAVKSANRILVAEDEPDTLRGIEKLLRKEGYDVEGVPDGSAAIDRLRKEPFDVVVTDLKLPGADGLEVLRQAKKVDENIVVIVVTGYASVDSALDAGRLGTFEYIPKPYTPSVLRASVDRAIQSRQGDRLPQAASGGSVRAPGLPQTVPESDRLAESREKMLERAAVVIYKTESASGFKSPKETVKAVEAIGCAKAAMSWQRLLTLGFLAGAFIALGGLLAIVVGGGIPAMKLANPGLQKFIFGAVFPVGLMLVVIAGAELFTGNTACCMPAVLSRKIPWRACAKNWGLSYVGNFVGSLFVAFFLAYLTGLLAKEPWLATTVGIAEAKVAQGFWALLLKGIGCNWLVCLAVWLAVAANDVTGKIWGIWFPIMAFVALGFEHSVANMFFIPAGILYGAHVTWGQCFVTNLVPVTLGNIVGGAFFVGAIYWYLYGRDK